MLETLFKDLRFGARTIAKSPGFLTVAVLSLALGIGANTAIFTLIDALMLRSLPVRAPNDLFSVGDPATLITSALVILSMALLAGFIPAQRASRIHPAITLRGSTDF